MKKLILVLSIVLMACNKDDNSDPYWFYDGWEPVYRAIVLTDGTIYQEDLDPCEKESKIVFSKQHNYLITTYSIENGICELQAEYVSTFSKNDNEVILYDEDGNVSANLVIYDLYGNVLRLGSPNTDSNWLAPNNEPVAYSYLQYQRTKYGPPYE